MYPAAYLTFMVALPLLTVGHFLLGGRPAPLPLQVTVQSDCAVFLGLDCIVPGALDCTVHGWLDCTVQEGLLSIL